MTSKTFTPGTVIDSAWLNDVNTNTYPLGLAKSDGSDATAAIQAIINANAGGVVRIPVGTFTVTTLTIPANTTIVGQGDFSVLKRKSGASAGPILSATNVGKVTVSNLKLDGNKAACTGGDANLFFTGCYDFTVERVRSVASVGHGLSFQNGKDTQNKTLSAVRDCIVNTATGYGIEVQDAGQLQIVDNRVENSGNSGIHVFGTIQYAVQGVLLDGNLVAGSAGNGINIPFVTGGTVTTPGVEEVVLVGNVVETSALNGFLVQSRFATVTGNTSSRNGTTMSHQGFVINTISVTATGNVASRNAGVGIDFGDCKRVVATGNVVEENGIIGIEVNSTEDFTINGNMVVNNNQTSQAAPLDAGILVHLGTGGYTFVGNSMNGSVSNNIVRSGPNQSYGIKLTADTSNVRIIGNDALGSGSVRDYEILTPSGQFITSGNTTQVPTLTAASTVTIPQVGQFFYVNAGTSISSIVTDGGTYEIGRQITLKFNGAVTVNNGTGNIYLNGSNLSANNGSVLVLVRADAGGWIEVSRRT